MSVTLNQSAPPAVAPASDDFRGGHWYGHDEAKGWFPLYAPDKDFTLREARKMLAEGLVAVPSVTTYFKVLHKEQLVKWREENVAKACYRMVADGFWPDETAYVDQAIATASGASRGAADLGTRIHQAIEDCVAGRDWAADLKLYVGTVMEERGIRGIGNSETEVAVGSLKYGYGGKLDDRTNDTMTIRDYKSRKSRPGAKKVPTYETDTVQLAAYGFASWGNEFFTKGKAELWGISTTQPGLLTVHDFTGAELVPAFEAFLSLTATWRFMNKCDPRVNI